MTVGRRDDLAYSILMIVGLVLYASTGADTLYASVWYLLGTPLLIIVWSLILGLPALFLTGATAAAVGTLLIYICTMSTMEHRDGLLVLGHVFSVPGMLVGIGIVAWVLRQRLKVTSPWLVAAVGFAGTALGFMAAQLVVCNTLMYCAALSLGLR